MADHFTSRSGGKSADLSIDRHDNGPQYGSETIIDTKAWVIGEHKWVKSDGQTMLTFTNMMLKLLHIKDGQGNLFTDVIAQFDQYNNTENDKGDHHCAIRIWIIDQNGQSLAVPYPNVFIVRDACRQRPTTLLPQVRLGTDFFASTFNFSWEGSADWNYEGGC